MLATITLATVTPTPMLAVKDVTRARRFYEEQLGLEPRRTLPNGEVVFQSDGGEFALYPRPTPPRAGRCSPTTGAMVTGAPRRGSTLPC